MAGEEGFEPPNAGTRTQCLTTWRLPIEWRLTSSIAENNRCAQGVENELFFLFTNQTQFIVAKCPEGDERQAEPGEVGEYQ